jgi:hypothetical protein
VFSKKGNVSKKSLSCTTLVSPIPEYRAAWWNPCREREINAIYRVKNIAVPFIHHTKDSDWETVA